MLALARQGRTVFLRHPWLLDTAETLRPIGPSAADYLEHALVVLAEADADTRTKLEAIGVLNALVAALTRAEIASENRTAQDTSFLTRIAEEGRHPHLTDAFASMTAAPETPAAVFDRVVSRVLTGLIEIRS